MLPPKPLAPFDAWPVQVADQEASLFAWFLEPNIFVFQYHDPVYKFITAQKVVHFTDTARDLRRAQIAEAKGIVVVHDARVLTRTEPQAQKYLDVAWKKLKAADVNAVYLVVGTSMPALARVALNFVNVVSALSTGKTMTFVTDFSEPFEKHAIKPPAPGAAFPGFG